MFKFVCTALLIILSVGPTLAAQIIPGLIPREYAIKAATDLPIPPEVAHQKAMNGEIDLSLLDPDATTNIWAPDKSEISENHLLKTNDTVKYLADLPSRIGIYRFSIETQGGTELIILLAKKAHNYLLRKNILEKLGYNVPEMQWVSELKINFQDTIDRDLFKEELGDQLFDAQARWITAEHGLMLKIQDAIVITPKSDIYNLTQGIMNRSVHRGRRLLRAPYLPLALVDTPESVNLFPWLAGRVVMNQIKLDHTESLQKGYSTSFEDAKWIARKVFKLSRKELKEIVIKAHYPKAIETLLIEKIVSRRNHLIKLFGLESEFDEYSFNANINFGKDVVNGEVTREFFPGYAARFSFGDPESPFSSSEMSSFVLSLIQSQSITAAITEMNKYISTDIEKRYVEKVKKVLMKDGPFTSDHAIGIPTVGGNAILSRDIIAGSYMGTNHKVQIADNIGFGLNLGGFGGIEGLPDELKVFGTLNLSLQRVYSHIKPIQSLKKAMKEPYKNLIVPMLVNGLAKKIDDLKSDDAEETEEQINVILSEIKKYMQVGESFIISESIGPSFGIDGVLPIGQQVGLDPTQLKVYAGLQARHMNISRFHLVRVGEFDFHVYQDYGKNMGFGLALRLDSYAPIIGISGNWNQVKAQTYYYPLSLSVRDTDAKTLKALRRSILKLNHSALKEVKTPFTVDHKIKERMSVFEFLFFKRQKIKQNHKLSVQHARGGEPLNLARRYDTWTSGVDYENFTIKALNSILDEVLEGSPVSIAQSPVMNPGFTIFGKANSKVMQSEFDGDRLVTTYDRIFNGWKIKNSKFEKILEKLNKEFGQEVINPLSYKDTDAVRLYQISMQMVLSDEATDIILNTPVLYFLDKVKRFPSNRRPDEFMTILKRRWTKNQRIARENLQSDPNRAMKAYHELINSLFSRIEIKEVLTLIGEDNYIIQARVDGFREGDENGDQPIISDSYGELPTPLHALPSERIMQQIGILQGELLANWTVKRAI